MKSEVTKAASMINYNIKAKHMEKMSNFFASRNFDLTVDMSNSAGEKKDLKKTQVAGENGDTAQTFMCKENIERDKEELANQIESSWAQRQGFPAKSG